MWTLRKHLLLSRSQLYIFCDFNQFFILRVGGEAGLGYDMQDNWLTLYAMLDRNLEIIIGLLSCEYELLTHRYKHKHTYKHTQAHTHTQIQKQTRAHTHIHRRSRLQHISTCFGPLKKTWIDLCVCFLLFVIIFLTLIYRRKEKISQKLAATRSDPDKDSLLWSNNLAVILCWASS